MSTRNGCSAECGTGVKEYTRLKLVSEAHGGNCIGGEGMTEQFKSEPCKERECPGNLVRIVYRLIGYFIKF